jgi:hypothetical protein
MKAANVVSGKEIEREPVADFEFDFHNKETRARFAIRCIFEQQLPDEISLFSERDVQYVKYLQQESDLYFILGVGGAPDDPKELFLLPAKEVTRNAITMKELQPYRKHGMFFYSSTNQMLQ